MKIVLHKETINIWTHMLACLYYIIVNNRLNIFTIYIFASILTFGTSTLYHIALSLNKNTNKILKLDLLMIENLNFVSNNLIVYHYYWCHRYLYINYLYMSIIYNIIGILILKNVDIIKYYSYYIGYIFIQNISLLYVYYDVYNREDKLIKKYNYCKAGIYYLLGFIIYVLKMPEIFKKDRFDLIGNSHQLWHIFSFIGSYNLYWELVEYHEYRKLNNCELVS